MRDEVRAVTAVFVVAVIAIGIMFFAASESRNNYLESLSNPPDMLLGKVVPPIYPTTCTDTDGLNYNTSGYVNGSSGGNYPTEYRYDDYCLTDTQLVEWYCSSLNNPVHEDTLYAPIICPYFCTNGKCDPAPVVRQSSGADLTIGRVIIMNEIDWSAREPIVTPISTSTAGYTIPFSVNFTIRNNGTAPVNMSGIEYSIGSGNTIFDARLCSRPLLLAPGAETECVVVSGRTYGIAGTGATLHIKADYNNKLQETNENNNEWIIGAINDSCTDSDNDNPMIGSYVSGYYTYLQPRTFGSTVLNYYVTKPYTKYDYCSDGNTLSEYACSGNASYAKQYTCRYGCASYSQNSYCYPDSSVTHYDLYSRISLATKSPSDLYWPYGYLLPEGTTFNVSNGTIYRCDLAFANVSIVNQTTKQAIYSPIPSDAVFNVRVRVKNNCNDSVINNGVNFSIGHESGTMAIGWCYLMLLGPGQEADCGWANTGGYSMAAGIHTLQVVIDTTDILHELNEYNNVWSQPLTVVQAAPPAVNSSNRVDLTIGRVSIIDQVTRLPITQPFNNSPFNVIVTMQNNGTAPVDLTNIDYSVGYEAGAMAIGVCSSGLLAPGLQTQCAIANLGGFGLSAGTHTLKIIADYTNKLQETYENNNEWNLTVVFSGTPPVVINSTNDSQSVSNPDTCTDSDGQNSLTPGNVSGIDRGYPYFNVDSCYDSHTLNEWVCENVGYIGNQSHIVQYDCAFGCNSRGYCNSFPVNSSNATVTTQPSLPAIQTAPTTPSAPSTGLPSAALPAPVIPLTPEVVASYVQNASQLLDDIKVNYSLPVMTTEMSVQIANPVYDPIKDELRVVISNTGSVALDLSLYQLYVLGNGVIRTNLADSGMASLNPGQSMVMKVYGSPSEKIFGSLHCGAKILIGVVPKANPNLANMISKTMIPLDCLAPPIVSDVSALQEKLVVNTQTAAFTLTAGHSLGVYPSFFMDSGLPNAEFVIGEGAVKFDVVGATDIVKGLQYASDKQFPSGLVKTDTNVDLNELVGRNTVVVGGMCANPLTAALYGNPSDCTSQDTRGVGKIKLMEITGGGTVLLVHGYSYEDTLRASRVVAHWSNYQDIFTTTNTLCVTGTWENPVVNACN